MAHQRFDSEFATFVRKELDELCTEFINNVAYEMANRVQKEHPDLAHFNIMNAISKVVRPSDGSEDKACEWFEMTERDISAAFSEEFSDEDDDDSGRYFRRNVQFKDDGEVRNLQFCRWDDYIEGDPEDEATFFYGLSLEQAVVGYDGGDWVIVE